MFVSRVQYRLIISVMALLIIISTITAIASLVILKNNIAGIMTPTQSVVVFTVITLILYLISLWLMIIWSNRIYGPIYRLGQYIQRLSKGEKTGEIKFRKGDTLDGLTELYNKLCQSVEKNLTYDYKEFAKIFTELENILDRLYNKNISERELYDSLQHTCNRIAKALDITSEVIKKIESRIESKE